MAVASVAADREARYWRPLPSGRVECTLCPRRCRLKDGQRGFCFLRACRKGRIVLAGSGRTSGLHADPIEKKPLYHFLPGTACLSYGTIGCNLACKFCQDWEISRSRDEGLLSWAGSPEAIANLAVRLGCRSVAFTYNDPVPALEAVVEVARACRRRGVKSVAVTAAYIEPEPCAELFGELDAANVDLKAFSDEFYRNVCGGRLSPVLDALLYIKHRTRVWLEITTLLIPGLNDTDRELEAMAWWVVRNLGRDVPWHFTAFHPAWRMPDRSATPLATMARARAIALDRGMRYVYTGNVHDPEGSRTDCRRCGGALLRRAGFRVVENYLTGAGRCRHCGAGCPGVFERRGAAVR